VVSNSGGGPPSRLEVNYTTPAGAEVGNRDPDRGESALLREWPGFVEKLLCRAVNLGGAGDFGEKFGRCTAHTDWQPDLSEHTLAEPRRDAPARPNLAAKSGHIEEWLADRHGFDLGWGVVEDLDDGLTGIAVGPYSWRDFDDVGAQFARLMAVHGWAHRHSPGLVAGGKDHTTADDHEPITKCRIIEPLDRRVERVEISMQDRRDPTHVPVIASVRREQHIAGSVLVSIYDVIGDLRSGRERARITC
jgi:hypothetical protein